MRGAGWDLQPRITAAQARTLLHGLLIRARFISLYPAKRWSGALSRTRPNENMFLAPHNRHSAAHLSAFSSP